MDETSLSLLDRLQHSSSESAWRDMVELYTPLLDEWLTRFKLQRIVEDTPADSQGMRVRSIG